ncbi:Ig-like domain-containing protein, partial [Vibrio lentus]|uniref:Ig-like domain-containing protein n=7 Tax=Vibrio TaxID=662 RepID=UPI001E60D013
RSNDDGITNDLRPIFEGKVEGAISVSVVIRDKDGNPVSTIEGQVAENGDWVATSPTDLVDGEYTWEVVARNNIGNSSISDKHKIVIDREIE